jgi:hypothetical protein
MVKNWNEKELIYLCNTDFLLTKQEITKNIITSLSDVLSALEETTAPFQNSLKAEYLKKNKKISKGENYLGLPYYVLDYPGHFKKEEIFAFRIMIWWGNEISFTLHLGGTVKSKFEQILQTKKSEIDHYCICVNDLPWTYHFNESNYLLIKDLSDIKYSEILKGKSFIKISTRLDIQEIGNIKEHAVKHLSQFLHVLFEIDQK